VWDIDIFAFWHLFRWSWFALYLSQNFRVSRMVQMAFGGGRDDCRHLCMCSRGLGFWLNRKYHQGMIRMAILTVVLSTAPMWCCMITYNFPAIWLVYLVTVALGIINHYILFKENDTAVCKMMGIFTEKNPSHFSRICNNFQISGSDR
jgi:hypothetical protein